MPCIKCESGKWKFGETGRCQYNSLQECNEANEGYYNEETYNDYPQSATNNAKRAIKYKEENGSSCGTQVGWTRARQIANREKLTRRTIARVASFKRHQQHKDVPYDEGCGGIMWDAWGGTSMIEWAIKKLESIDKKSAKNQEDKKEKIEIEEKFYNDEQHDYHFNFTEEMMSKLHNDGELIVKVEEGEKKMTIKFTYQSEEEHNNIMDLAKELKDINNKYKDRYGI